MVEPNGAVHPAAAAYPLLPPDELQALADDIAANGLLYPIVLDAEGQLIDGRNRLKACQLAGVEPRFTSLNGHDPVDYVLSANENRRHITKGQRAMAAARLQRLRNNGSGSSADVIKFITSDKDTAQLAGVSRQYVLHAHLVLDWAPELADGVRDGMPALSQAYDIARKRKLAAESEEELQSRQESERQQLQRDAPDLAALVTEDKLSMSDAQAALKQRREQRRMDEWATTKLLLSGLQDLAACCGSLATRTNTLDRFNPDMAAQEGQYITKMQLLQAAHDLQTLAEEWPDA
jgi:hypothetical protein